jgi:hypothetical protein
MMPSAHCAVYALSAKNRMMFPDLCDFSGGAELALLLPAGGDRASTGIRDDE